jgi:YHS domain-containing protein
MNQRMNRINLHPPVLVTLLASGLMTAVTFAAAPATSSVERPANGRLFSLSEAQDRVFNHVSKEQFEAEVRELQDDPGAIKHYNLGPDKVAISGYDPVAYFTQSKALKGRKELSASHRGVTYHFASEQNRNTFASSPEKFIPTYGGWCATAMAKGEKVEIDPTNFKVTNGRLFLFFRAFYANAIKDWNKDEPGQTVKADANWKKIAGE